MNSYFTWHKCIQKHYCYADYYQTSNTTAVFQCCSQCISSTSPRLNPQIASSMISVVFVFCISYIKLSLLFCVSCTVIGRCDVCTVFLGVNNNGVNNPVWLTGCVNLQSGLWRNQPKFSLLHSSFCVCLRMIKKFAVETTRDRGVTFHLTDVFILYFAGSGR